MMTMTEKYKILGKYIKDMSSETPDIETYIYVKDHISKYQLGIDINSKALKNKMIEINTLLKFEDKAGSEKKSHFEINFSTIIKINDELVSSDKLNINNSYLNNLGSIKISIGKKKHFLIKLI